METPPEIRKIEIDQETLKHLNTTRKWAMFLAIVGFIFLGLIVIVGLIAGTFLTAFSTGEKGLGIPESLMFIPVLLISAIYFFPVLFLFRFSKHTHHAIQTPESLFCLHRDFDNRCSYILYLSINSCRIVDGFFKRFVMIMNPFYNKIDVFYQFRINSLKCQQVIL
jgi:hypothetical protein